MAKLTIKNITNVLNEFKTSLFIGPALDKFNINHYDFFEFINSNKEVLDEYEKISNYNNIILEDKVAQDCYLGDGNDKILLEMVKANNKKKYIVKTELEVTSKLKEMSDEDLDEMIKNLSKNLNKD